MPDASACRKRQIWGRRVVRQIESPGREQYRLPPQQSAGKRAVGRAFGRAGRLAPLFSYIESLTPIGFRSTKSDRAPTTPICCSRVANAAQS